MEFCVNTGQFLVPYRLWCQKLHVRSFSCCQIPSVPGQICQRMFTSMITFANRVYSIFIFVRVSSLSTVVLSTKWFLRFTESTQCRIWSGETSPYFEDKAHVIVFKCEEKTHPLQFPLSFPFLKTLKMFLKHLISYIKITCPARVTCYLHTSEVLNYFLCFVYFIITSIHSSVC